MAIATATPSPLRSPLTSSRFSNRLFPPLPSPTSHLLIRCSSSRIFLPRERRPHRRILAAAPSESQAFETSNLPVRLTYLEANSWLWELEGMNLLVDPILVGNLDFGIPMLYDGAKRFIKNYQLKDLPELDSVLITQGLDDHCHSRTLKALSQMRPNLQIIAAPSAKPILSSLFSNVSYLAVGQIFELQGKNGSKLCIRATAGPVLGPPWQEPENGYLISLGDGQASLYYEPHCVCDMSLLEKERADIVITPVIKQLLPSFTLVSGQEDAVKLAKTLQARFVIPMSNGNLDAKGILASILRKEGTLDSFKQLLFGELPGVRILEPTAGIPLEIPVTSTVQ